MTWLALRVVVKLMLAVPELLLARLLNDWILRDDQNLWRLPARVLGISLSAGLARHGHLALDLFRLQLALRHLLHLLAGLLDIKFGNLNMALLVQVLDRIVR